MNNPEVSIRNMENQMGQLVSAINNRPQGTLPRDTEINPRRECKEYCKAVTLRSGKELHETIGEPTQKSQTVREEDIDAKKKNSKNREQENKAGEDPTLSFKGSKQIPHSLYRFRNVFRNKSWKSSSLSSYRCSKSFISISRSPMHWNKCLVT